LPPGFVNETGFGFMRDFDTHGTAPLLSIPLVLWLRGVEIAAKKHRGLAGVY
jgi:hypothetical protein